MSDGGNSFNAGIWLPLVFTLAGWIIIHHQNASLAARKEARDAIDRCKALCRSAASEALASLTHRGTKKTSRSLHIIAEYLEELDVELKRFPLYENKSPLVYRLAVFSKFAMGIDEAAEELDESELALLQTKIKISRSEFLIELEKQFKVHYC